MVRFGHLGLVHLWEEPVFEARDNACLTIDSSTPGVRVITPLLPPGLKSEEIAATQQALLDQYLKDAKVHKFIAWYYTPMVLKFSSHLKPILTVYDCMDELSAFQSAPPELLELEQRLFAKADVVFAGGASLYASKCTQHENVHLFPSSIDYAHFAAARQGLDDPSDQKDIPHPRIGFCGVLDERLDQDLLRALASLHPEWNLILIGPVVKIRRDDLPNNANLHYLNQKNYSELPAYLAHWDVAMLPFALNSSTRFISPTKTPEYLAAGRPVVSTPIQDVVNPYEKLGLVRIGAGVHEFGDAIEACLCDRSEDRLARVDLFLAGNSWDKTFDGMWHEIRQCMTQALRQASHEAIDFNVGEHANV